MLIGNSENGVRANGASGLRAFDRKTLAAARSTQSIAARVRAAFISKSYPDCRRAAEDSPARIAEAGVEEPSIIRNASTKTTQPENSWNNPSAPALPKLCAATPALATRKPLARMATGIEERAITTRTQARLSTK